MEIVIASAWTALEFLVKKIKKYNNHQQTKGK